MKRALVYDDHPVRRLTHCGLDWRPNILLDDYPLLDCVRGRREEPAMGFHQVHLLILGHSGLRGRDMHGLVEDGGGVVQWVLVLGAGARLGPVQAGLAALAEPAGALAPAQPDYSLLSAHGNRNGFYYMVINILTLKPD